jgi:hypothetical protein
MAWSAARKSLQRGSRIDARTTPHRGYAASRRPRKHIEEIIGWGTDRRALAQAAHPGRQGAQVPGHIGYRVQYLASGIHPHAGKAMSKGQRCMMSPNAQS